MHSSGGRKDAAAVPEDTPCAIDAEDLALLMPHASFLRFRYIRPHLRHAAALAAGDTTAASAAMVGDVRPVPTPPSSSAPLTLTGDRPVAYFPGLDATLNVSPLVLATAGSAASAMSGPLCSALSLAQRLSHDTWCASIEWRQWV